MRNRDLVILVSDKTGFTRMDVEEVLNKMVDTVVEYMDKGHKLRVSGLGTFGFSDLPAKVCGGAPHINGKCLPPRRIPRFWFHRSIHKRLTKYEGGK